MDERTPIAVALSCQDAEALGRIQPWIIDPLHRLIVRTALDRSESGNGFRLSEIVRLIEDNPLFDALRISKLSGAAAEAQVFSTGKIVDDLIDARSWERIVEEKESGPGWRENVKAILEETARPIEHRLSIVSAEAERTADIPPRTWFVDEMVTTGTTLLTARKAVGKSFFALQAGHCIAGGFPFLGRKTLKSKVLYVSTELDRIALHERLERYGPAPEGLFVHYGWRKGDAGIRDAERAIQDHGIRVLIVDMFTGVLPSNAETNSYDLSPFLLRWRQMAQQNNAGSMLVWHSSKTDRSDPMLAALGTTALAGQSDSVLVLERQRNSHDTTIHAMGNHGREQKLKAHFENLTWTLADGSEPDRECRPGDEPVLKFIREHGRSTAPNVAAILSKTDASVRSSLARLAELNLVVKDGREWVPASGELL